MAQTYRARFLAVVAANEARMSKLFTNLTRSITSEVLRQADTNGIVPRSKTYEVQRVAGELVNALFVGRGRGNEGKPFALHADGSVLPLSPYMRALWLSITEVTTLAVRHHERMMLRRLPSDIESVLKVARGHPFTLAERYEAPHLWVDAKGFRLSDRIWTVAGNTRQRVDAYLDEALRSGLNAAVISKELERFLVPGKALPAKRTAYGTDASYEAMRLARTEIARAYARAGEMGALLNPFVEQLAVALSHKHMKCAACNKAAEAGPWAKGQVPEQYKPPLHGMCLCRFRYILQDAAQTEATIANLRAEIRSTRAQFVGMIGPLKAEEFTQLLLRGQIHEPATA